MSIVFSEQISMKLSAIPGYFSNLFCYKAYANNRERCLKASYTLTDRVIDRKKHLLLLCATPKKNLHVHWDWLQRKQNTMNTKMENLIIQDCTYGFSECPYFSEYPA